VSRTPMRLMYVGCLLGGTSMSDINWTRPLICCRSSQIPGTRQQLRHDVFGAQSCVIFAIGCSFGTTVRVVGSTRWVSSRGMRKIRERPRVLPSDFQRWSTAGAALMRHTRHMAPVTQTPLYNGRAMESTTAHSRFGTLGPPSPQDGAIEWPAKTRRLDPWMIC